jgi:thymidylate synthase (FAD)
MHFWYPDEWRINNQENKQSSSKRDLLRSEVVRYEGEMKQSYQSAVRAYHSLLNEGVAREQARAVLPLATYTEFYWTVNARSLFNFIKLRTHEGAQKEIQDYAFKILEMVKDIAPWTFEAFENYGGV